MLEIEPRQTTSVLVEELADSVVVTWGLGEPAGVAHYWGGEVFYYAPDGNGGKRFSVEFFADTGTTAHVWDNASTTQANYTADHVEVTEKAIIARYPDAGLGIAEIGAIAAYSHINGVDHQRDLPVSLLR